MSRYKYEMLLAAQLLLSAISPLFSSSAHSRLIIDIAITAVFMTAIYVIASTRRHFIIGMVLMVPALTLTWGVKIYQVPQLEYLSLLGAAVFFSYVAALILIDIFRSKMVTLDLMPLTAALGAEVGGVDLREAPANP